MGKKTKSSGTLLYRRTPNLEVLIIHPSGAYNRNAAWSIPKGKIENEETPEETARRETFEEVGITCPEILHSLGSVVYKSGKTVYGYYAEISSETIPVINWEADKAEFVSLEKAEDLLLHVQKEFVQRLRNALGIPATGLAQS